MMSRNQPKWTKAEKARADRMKAEIGCIHCWLNFGCRIECQEIHHLLSGNRQIGHWWTLPLCKPCHIAAHNSTFKHRQQIDRWLKCQHILGLDDSLPTSKIIPRRVA